MDGDTSLYIAGFAILGIRAPDGTLYYHETDAVSPQYSLLSMILVLCFGIGLLMLWAVAMREKHDEWFQHQPGPHVSLGAWVRW